MQSAKRVNVVSVKLVKESSLYMGRRISSPQDSAALFREYLGEVDREHFVVMCLNTKKQLTNISTLHIGSLNASLVHPHPSGDPAPSPKDIDVTERLVEAGRVIGIDVLDHIALGDERFISLKEKGERSRCKIQCMIS
ncbi:JAB domain-containing protein [Bacillus mycoides]|uniref:JAB domain-containing protein n=1 Tax=Bacillus mycoides TaxID=1405 RepID=UPI003D094EF0